MGRSFHIDGKPAGLQPMVWIAHPVDNRHSDNTIGLRLVDDDLAVFDEHAGRCA
jgi:hypothetical protein